jgi:hypothetical protein
VKGSVVQFVFVVLALVLGGALEDMLPAVGGIGFPVLLGLAVFCAATADAPAWILAAVAAGAFEDALAAQPAGASIVFFAAVATAVRFFREPLVWTLVAYPAYRVWLGLVSDGAGAFGHVFLSVPVGAFTLAAVFALLSFVWGKVGADA